jgi:hypothetical protein
VPLHGGIIETPCEPGQLGREHQTHRAIEHLQQIGAASRKLDGADRRRIGIGRGGACAARTLR